MGIGFAVPIDMAVRIKDQLIATGKVTRGYVGVFLNPGEVTREMAASFGRSEAGGVLIAEVQKDGPADKAGIKSGDILIELNGKKIVGNTDFRNDVARIMPNEKAEVLLFRDGKTRKVTVTVAAFPEDEQGTDAGGESGGAALLEKLGLQVQDLTQEIAQQLGYENLRGVVISDVMQGSVADEAGLRPGMLILEVNRAEVKNARQFEAAVGKAKGSNVLVRVKTKEGTIFLNLPTQE